MDAILVEYDIEKNTLEFVKGVVVEDWIAVCSRFNDDVRRVRDVDDIETYTALYECFDEKDKKHYYLVKEDDTLFKMRRKIFLRNIGK
jgi:hypothetical protein